MQPPNLITDFTYYHSELECPPRYFLWATVQMISTIAGPRFYVNRVYENLRVNPALYTCLVGPQGAGKSEVKKTVSKVIRNEFDGIPLSANVDSVTSIVKIMAKDDCIRKYADAKGVQHSYRPFCFIVNEFASLLTFSSAAIIDFIVDIWGEDNYQYRTERQGNIPIDHPYLTILGCGTISFIMDKLNEKVLTGGAARRVIFVPVFDYPEPKSPQIPEGAHEAYKRAIVQLHRITSLAGEIVWAPGVYDLYEDWRLKRERGHANPNMAGFLGTKPDLVVKVMMALALAEYDTKLELRADHMELALAMFTDIEPDMERLFIGAGMSHVAAATAQVTDFLDRQGGMMMASAMRKMLFQSAHHPRDVYAIEEHLKKTGEITVFVQNNQEVVLSEKRRKQLHKEEKQNDQPPAS